MRVGMKREGSLESSTKWTRGTSGLNGSTRMRPLPKLRERARGQSGARLSLWLFNYDNLFRRRVHVLHTDTLCTGEVAAAVVEAVPR